MSAIIGNMLSALIGGLLVVFGTKLWQHSVDDAAGVATCVVFLLVVRLFLYDLWEKDRL